MSRRKNRRYFDSRSGTVSVSPSPSSEQSAVGPDLLGLRLYFSPHTHRISPSLFPDSRPFPSSQSVGHTHTHTCPSHTFSPLPGVFSPLCTMKYECPSPGLCPCETLQIEKSNVRGRLRTEEREMGTSRSPFSPVT